MTRFNLVDEPWIPCVMLDGSQQEVSLRDALGRAREIREVYDPSPLVTVALHRLLLTVLHSVFGPRNDDEWKPLWRRGHWDIGELDAYWARWRHRFDLFGSERPFAQVPRMGDAGERPIAALLIEAASGNNATLFDHGLVEGAEAVPAGRAACYLLAHQAFAVGFGKSKPFYLKDAPLTRGFTAMAYGENLFETLALNLMSKDFWTGFAQKGDDAPFWERDILPEPDEEGTYPLGRKDYLSWLSRRVHLIPEGESLRVAQCQIQQNYCLPPDPIQWDPFMKYRRDDKSGWNPARLMADRAVWRDCHALLHMKMDGESRPELLNWLAHVYDLRAAGEIEARPQYQLVIFGMATAIGKAASVELWRSERLPLPLVYLNNEGLLDLLKMALDLAKDVGTALRRSVWSLAGQLVTDEDVERLANHLSTENLFWPRLEAPFRRLLVEISEGGGLDEWGQGLERAARNAFREVRQEVETSSGVLHALVTADRFFNRELAKALEPLRKEDDLDSAI